MNHGTLTKLAMSITLDRNETQLLIEALPQSQLTSLSITILFANDFIDHAHVVSKTKLDFLSIEVYFNDFTIAPGDKHMLMEILHHSKLRTFVFRGYNEHVMCNRYNQMIVNSCD